MFHEICVYAENFGHIMGQLSIENVKVLIVFVRRDTLKKSSVLEECFMEYRSGGPIFHRKNGLPNKNFVTSIL